MPERDETAISPPHAAAATLPLETQKTSHPPHPSHRHCQSLPGRMVPVLGALCMRRESICRRLPSLTHLPFVPTHPTHSHRHPTCNRQPFERRQDNNQKHAGSLRSAGGHTMGVWVTPRGSPAGTPTCAAANGDQEAPHPSRQGRGTSAATATTHAISPLLAGSERRAECDTI